MLARPAAPHAAAPQVDPADVEVTAIRAQGPGGQNVNKVSSAIQLRYDVRAARLPEAVKQRLLVLAGQRASKDGVIVIKAQTARSQEQNRADALARLQALVDAAAHEPVARKPTRPTKASRLRRLQHKAERSQLKAGRAGRWPDGT